MEDENGHPPDTAAPAIGRLEPSVALNKTATGNHAYVEDGHRYWARFAECDYGETRRLD